MADEGLVDAEKSSGGVFDKDSIASGTKSAHDSPKTEPEADGEAETRVQPRLSEKSSPVIPDSALRRHPEASAAGVHSRRDPEIWVPHPAIDFEEPRYSYQSVPEWANRREHARKTNQRLNIAAYKLKEYKRGYLELELLPYPEEMGEQPQLIFVDGAFTELAQEMADFLQIGDQVRPLLEQDQREEALQAIVKASGFFNSVAEKEFTAAYNLLIHLVLQSKEPKKYLPMICGNLNKPITSSPTHGTTLAANALATIFNLLDPFDSLRYNVFLQILRFVKQNNQYDNLKPRLKNVPGWLKDWDMDEEDQRKMYLEVVEVASDAGDDDEAYLFVLRAIGTFDPQEPDEITSEEAQQLSLRALRMALSDPSHFDFQELRVLPSVQALSDSQPVYSQLLDIFSEQDLEDYNDFREEHEGFVEKASLDHEVLQRKLRLLTFASLAASNPNREIPYNHIAKALQIPSGQVEKWCIDVIRAGLVEGRLSQKDNMFLVHRTTYRVFGEKQWRELGTRVDQYRTIVDNLTGVVRRQQTEAATQKEREVQEVERKLANISIGGGGQGGDRRRGGQQQPRQFQQPQQGRERTDNDD